MGISSDNELAAITIPFATGSVSEANMRSVMAPILKEAVEDLMRG